MQIGIAANFHLNVNKLNYIRFSIRNYGLFDNSQYVTFIQFITINIVLTKTYRALLLYQNIIYLRKYKNCTNKIAKHSLSLYFKIGGTIYGN